MEWSFHCGQEGADYGQQQHYRGEEVTTYQRQGNGACREHSGEEKKGLIG
jgi:hypothetical protein